MRKSRPRRLLRGQGTPSRVMGAVLAFLLLPGLIVGLTGARTWAVEYGLEVDSLQDEAFRYFVRDPLAKGEGEPAVPGLAPALGADTVGAGAFLYDRDLEPASPGEARLFGALTVPVIQPMVAGEGTRQVVRWEGAPGQRTVWVVKPATTHWQKLSRLALGVKNDTMRYYIPYQVSLTPRRSVAITYPLASVRSFQNATAPFQRSVGSSLDLGMGVAAVVGANRLAGDWVYLIVQQPPAATTFTAVLGWDKRGPTDEAEHGVRPRAPSHR